MTRNHTPLIFDTMPEPLSLPEIRRRLLGRFVHILRKSDMRPMNAWGEAVIECMPEKQENILFLYRELRQENPAFEEMYFSWRNAMLVREVVYEYLIGEYEEVASALENGRFRFFVRFRPDGYETTGVQVTGTDHASYSPYCDMTLTE